VQPERAAQVADWQHRLLEVSTSMSAVGFIDYTLKRIIGGGSGGAATN